MSDNPAAFVPHDLTPDVAFALEALVRVVERHSGEFKASVLLVSDDGRRVLDAAGPSLPDDYRRAIHGLEIGPVSGSCGTAAYRNERVIVSDIEHDPLWEPYRDIVRPFGLVACWSQPIRDAEGGVLGTFAMYYTDPREPTTKDLQIITAAARRAAILIEQGRSGADREELIAGIGQEFG